MIYISYGVPKSASTFTYVVTEHVLRTAGLAPVELSEAAKGNKSRLNYVDPINGAALDRIRAELGDRSAVIKTHGAPDRHVLDAVEHGDVFASAVIRDPREIALSLLDHGRRSRNLGVGDFADFMTPTDTFSALDDQFARLSRWLQSGKVLLLTYDEIAFDTEFAVQRIIDQLGLPVAAAAVLSALPDRDKVEQFNKGVSQRFASEMSVETQRLFLDRYADLYRRYIDADISVGGKSVPLVVRVGSGEAERADSPTAEAPRKDNRMSVTAADAERFRWFHSIDLGNGVVTKGQKSLALIEGQAGTVFRYGVAGKSVLDIGAWDGAFSFEAERRGAARVLATDHFCWIGPGWGKKASFDFARSALASRVEAKIIDVDDISVESIGKHDVVLFLGVLYHLLHPLMVLQKIAPVVGEMLVVDTETALDDEERPAMVFFPGAELNKDPTNWWAPNIKCMQAMLGHIGFKRVEVSPTFGYDGGINHRRGRFTFHAWR